MIPKITDPGQAIELEYDEGHKVKEMKSGLLFCFSTFFNFRILEKLFGKSFRPPEVYLKGSYHPIKVDTFCLGWMMFFAVAREQAFARALYQDPNWFLILYGEYHFNMKLKFIYSLCHLGKTEELLRQKNVTHLSAAFKDLIFKMLNPDPRRRPSPGQCLEHPWFGKSKYYNSLYYFIM